MPGQLQIRPVLAAGPAGEPPAEGHVVLPAVEVVSLNAVSMACLLSHCTACSVAIPSGVVSQFSVDSCPGAFSSGEQLPKPSARRAASACSSAAG